jgi:2-methylisocitrate lyase-like PEP mutase family enzyme
MIFAEALYSLEDYLVLYQPVPVPVLANITEFGKTPLFTVEELKGVGVRVVLCPLSAFRAMSAAAVRVYETIRKSGTQKRRRRPDANARAAVRRSERLLLRRQAGSTIYKKPESLNL